MGKEIFSGKFYKESLTSMTISYGLNQLVTCGDGSVKISELSNLQDCIAVLNFDVYQSTPIALEFSDDSSFLTVMTSS